MRSVKRLLALSMLFAGLLVCGYFGTYTFAGSIAMLFEDAPGMVAATTLGQWSAWVAGACLVASMALIALAAALLPGGWGRKLVLTLPAFLLAVLLVGVGMSLAGVGRGIFVQSWLLVSGALAMLATLVAVLRLDLGGETLRRAVTGIAVAAVPIALVCLSLALSLVIVSTNEPQTQGSGGPGGAQAPGPQTGGAAGSSLAATAQAGAASTASGTTSAQSGTAPAPGRSDAASGAAAPGGAPRRRGPDPAAVVASFRRGALPTLATGLLAVILAARGWRALRVPAIQAAMRAQAAPASDRGELGRAVASGLILGVGTLLVIQVVPVSRDNPPNETVVNWDSVRTEELATRACMDCHSHATRWPWHAYVAPSSWLVRLHVSQGRERLNFTAINQYPADRRENLPDSIERRITNGSMPLPDYLMIHPAARLTEAEQAELIEGMKASLAATP